MRDVGDAVVVEDQARLQLRLGLRKLRLRDSVRSNAIELLEQRGFDSRQRRAFGRGRRNRIQKRLLGRQQGAGHVRRRGRVRPARDTAARCAAAEARGSWTTGSGLSRQSARRREPAAGQNSGSATAGAW